MSEKCRKCGSKGIPADDGLNPYGVIMDCISCGYSWDVPNFLGTIRDMECLLNDLKTFAARCREDYDTNRAEGISEPARQVPRMVHSLRELTREGFNAPKIFEATESGRKLLAELDAEKDRHE